MAIAEKVGFILVKCWKFAIKVFWKLLKLRSHMIF